MAHKYQLEPYASPQSRHTCPQCSGNREFSRYIDALTGEHVAPDVGRCNRESKCGYHKTPKEFFAENGSIELNSIKRTVARRERGATALPERNPDFIAEGLLTISVAASEQNAFTQYLSNHFSPSAVASAVATYSIGTWRDGRTVFWQIDIDGRIRTGKLMSYNPTTGKRLKSRPPSWVHAELQRESHHRSDESPSRKFNLQQCHFGEHLLTKRPTSPIGVVESEKTAIIASIVIPNLAWIATGGASNLKIDRLANIAQSRRVILFPDSSKFDAWSKKCFQAKNNRRMNITVSDLVQRKLSDEQRSRDYDLADLLLRPVH